MSCDCEVCQRIREFRARVERVPAEDREFWECLFDGLLEVEQDLDWHKAVADGSWPSAAEILRGWLAKAEAQ